MNLARQIWEGFVQGLIWATVFLLPRSSCLGHGTPASPNEYRATRLSFVGPALLLLAGIFLLAPYQKATHGWWIMKAVGLLATVIGLAAGYVFLQVRVEITGGKVIYRESWQRLIIPLSSIANVYSTPGFIHLRLREGRTVKIPKLFKQGAGLLARLRAALPAS